MVQAIDRLDGDVDPGELRSEIEATSGFVGVGGTFSFSSEDHNGLSEDDLHVYRIVDGAWTSYAE